MKKLKIFTFILCFLFSYSNINLFSFNKTKLESLYSLFFTKAENLKKEGEFNKSIEFFEKSLNIARNLFDVEKECESIIKLGILYWNIGKLKQSTDYYRQANSIAQKFNLKIKQKKSRAAIEIFKLYTEGKKLYTEGKKSRSLGLYQKSIESLQEAINLAKEIESKEHEVKCLRQLSATYWKLNDLQNFFTLSKEALKIAEELKHKKEQGRCLNNIGLYYWKSNHYSKSLIHYQKALNIARKELNRVNEAELLSNIGIIYQDIGQYEKAIENLIKALKIDRQLGNDIYISMDLNNIGSAFRSKALSSSNEEDFNNALDYFKQCLKLTRKTDDKKTEIQVLNNIGTTHSDLENYLEAIRYFQSGLKKAEEIHDIEAMGMILNNMGIVYFNQGNYIESTRYYQRAIDLALEIKGGQILWEAYLELAKAYSKQKELKKALQSYKNSISIIENIRSQIKLEELKATYLGTDKRIAAYHNLIDLLVSLHRSEPEKGYDRQAFNYLERAKARAFLDRLEISQVNISNGINYKLINQEKELMKDISKLYTKLLATELSFQEKNNIQKELDNLESQLETLKREIRSKSPAYAGLKYPQIITLEQTQKEILNKKTAFFAYSIGEENSFLFVITKNSLKIFSIPSRDDLQKLVKDYLKVITDKDNKNFQSGYTLFRKLVQPGLEEGISNLIFVPEDILHFLPFEALITNEEKKDWLIEDYKIAYIPSISSLREITHYKKSMTKKPQKDILAFGDPSFGFLETEENGGDIFQNFYSSSAFNFSRLKYSGYELQRISALFKQTKRKIFQRNEATEEQLKEHDLSNYKIIHFATHSLIDDKKPQRSSIVLSLDEDPEEDGFLQMREVYNLNLNSDLVVLSACQTGLGQFIRGEGIEGLNRAFFYSGASSVLMSLWSVNDQASAQLMERFYYHLRSSEPIVNALRKAKLEMISSNILSHPYYWAGFIVSGNANKIIFARTIYKRLLLGLSLILGLGILFVIVRKSLSYRVSQD